MQGYKFTNITDFFKRKGYKVGDIILQDELDNLDFDFKLYNKLMPKLFEVVELEQKIKPAIINNEKVIIETKELVEFKEFTVEVKEEEKEIIKEKRKKRTKVEMQEVKEEEIKE